VLDLTGRILADRYELLRVQGESSLGVVWAARDRREGRRVAVKVVDAATGVDPVRFARFARELQASFLVTHPNTVEVLESGEAAVEGVAVRWLALEWLACHPLSDTLAKGPLPWARAAGIAVQVAHALGAAHQENHVHRALAPERILMLENCDGDYAKVADFGMAKLLGAEDDAEITNADTTTRLGDHRYVAPEYVEHGTFGPRADLYALGAVLFHLVAGRPPFQGQLAELFEAHLRGTPPRLSTLAPGVPAWLDRLVAELLAKDPAQRPGVHEIVQRIEDGLERPVQLPALWPLDPEGAPIRPVAAPEPRSSPAALVLGGVLVVGIGLGGAALLVTALAAVLFVLSR
jgi:eukaryotic-like serine/threonine-protein kinase